MDILVPEIAVAEKILRSVVVYGLLLVAFRMAASGRRSARKASRPWARSATLLWKRTVT